MNTVNASTGYSGFQLLMGRSPRVIPPLTKTAARAAEHDIGKLAANTAHRVLSRLQADVMEAQDNLLLAKAHQAQQADRHRGPEVIYNVGDRVLASTLHRRREYMQRGDNRVAKFMVRYDGPYVVTKAHPDTSSYTLDLPPHVHIHPTFHASLLRPFIENDPVLFPSRSYPEPGPILTEDGQQEHVVDSIIAHKKVGRRYLFLVRWQGYGPAHDQWCPQADVDDLEALDIYLAKTHIPGLSPA